MTNGIGAKITIPGKGVSSLDVRDYLLHSGYKNPKVFLVGTGSKTFTSEADAKLSQTLLTVNWSDLGYTPFAVVFYNKDNSEFSGLPWWQHYAGYDPEYEWEFGAESYIDYIVSSNQLTIDYLFNIEMGFSESLINTGLTGAVFTFKYYIFVDRGMP